VLRVQSDEAIALPNLDVVLFPVLDRQVFRVFIVTAVEVDAAREPAPVVQQVQAVMRQTRPPIQKHSGG
jgi:hypothetical protein